MVVVAFYVTFVLPLAWWDWLSLPYPAAALLLSVRHRPRLAGPAGQVSAPARRRLWRANARLQGPRDRGSAVFAVTAICAAACAAALYLPFSHPVAGPEPLLSPPGMHEFQDRCWVAVLAGLAVLVVLALARGIAGLACASACLTTLLTITGLFAGRAITGHTDSLDLLVLTIEASGAGLFFLSIPASCLALLAARPANRPRHWQTIPITATAVVITLTAVVAATRIPALLAPNLGAPAPQGGSPPAQHRPRPRKPAQPRQLRPPGQHRPPRPRPQPSARNTGHDLGAQPGSRRARRPTAASGPASFR